jgi:hypothetical protein
LRRLGMDEIAVERQRRLGSLDNSRKQDSEVNARTTCQQRRHTGTVSQCVTVCCCARCESESESDRCLGGQGALRLHGDGGAHDTRIRRQESKAHVCTV